MDPEIRNFFWRLIHELDFDLMYEIYGDDTWIIN